MHNQELAPVVMFVYNRPIHTEKSLESLQKNKLAKETILYVYADGSKLNSSTEEKKKITDTRNIIKTLTGFKQVVLIEKEKNEGLAISVITGVTEIVNKHGKVIVLEDDLLVSPYFLDFMNEGLDAYESSPNIYSINGYMFPVEHQTPSVVLLPYTSTWGWATWAEKWKVFNTNMEGKEFLKSNPFLACRFNLGHYKYNDMLSFENNSWGIKWYFSVFIRGGLNVFPTISLVRNIGFDGSGTNGGNSNESHQNFVSKKLMMCKKESIDLDFFNKFINHFKKENISLPRRLFKFLKNIKFLKQLK